MSEQLTSSNDTSSTTCHLSTKYTLFSLLCSSVYPSSTRAGTFSTVFLRPSKTEKKTILQKWSPGLFVRADEQRLRQSCGENVQDLRTKSRAKIAAVHSLHLLPPEPTRTLEKCVLHPGAPEGGRPAGSAGPRGLPSPRTSRSSSRSRPRRKSRQAVTDCVRTQCR